MTALLAMLKKRSQMLGLWQALFVVSVVWGFISSHMTEQTMMQRIRFVAMDERNTKYISSLGTFETAQAIHSQSARDAVATIFSRNPDGFDFPERAELLFGPKASVALRQEAAKDAETFRLSQRHQKVEMGQVTEINLDSNTILMSVEAQVQGRSVFNQRIIDDARNVLVFVRLKVNGDMADNGRFPLVVVDYKEQLVPENKVTSK
jgi:predicted sulfurtransferase